MSRSFASNESENENANVSRNQRNDHSRTNTEFDQNSVTANSSAEINRLSSELNSRISREMDEMMNSVSVQIQRAINDAISTQVLPQIQNAIMAGSGRGTRKGWDAPSERPDLNSEVQRNLSVKSNSRNEQDEDQLNNDYPDLNVHDMVTGDNESPNQVPEFSQDVSHQEAISISPMRTSTLTRRSQRTRELLQLPILIPLLDWPTS